MNKVASFELFQEKFHVVGNTNDNKNFTSPPY